jgi:acyl-coenzyme A synthetase/AMP-(fatty) acid ligase
VIEIIEELPKSGTGKILRRALKEQLVEKVAL